jgi:hypothetical protein
MSASRQCALGAATQSGRKCVDGGERRHPVDLATDHNGPDRPGRAVRFTSASAGADQIDRLTRREHEWQITGALNEPSFGVSTHISPERVCRASAPWVTVEDLHADAGISVRQIGSISGLRLWPWAKD